VNRLAPVTLWLTEVELTAALESAILRDVDPQAKRSYWTDRKAAGQSDTYAMCAHAQTLEFFSL
jgi:hypothetical protein